MYESVHNIELDYNHVNKICVYVYSKHNTPTPVRHSDFLLSALHSFQRRSLFCDTEIVARDATIHAHSLVLAAASPQLCATLNQSPSVTPSPNVIDLQQYEAVVIQELVGVLYAGRLEATHTSELLSLCELLGIVVDVASPPCGHPKTLTDFDDTKRAGVKDFKCETIDSGDVCCKVPVVSLKVDSLLSAITVNDLALECINPSERVRLSDENVTCPVDMSVVCAEFDDDFPSDSFIEGSCEFTNQVKSGLCNMPVGLTASKRTRFKCLECRMNCRSMRTLNTHVQVMHSGPANDHDGDLRCPKCKKTFKRAFCLNRHMLLHERLEESGRSHNCTICGACFGTSSEMRRHRGTVHLGATTHTCVECCKEFKTDGQLRHHEYTHRRDKRYLCTTCGKGFFLHHALVVHARVHNGDRPYECAVCPRRFTQPSARLVHQRRHTQDRPYLCADCARAFFTSTELKNHILNRHADASEKPYGCERCGKTFGKQWMVTRHRCGSAKEYLCVPCGKRFSTPGNLKRHSDICSI